MNSMFLNVKGKNVEEKKKIAKKAFELIEEGDFIFLDISTINIELIKLIVEANLNVTVATNMIDVMLGFTASLDTNLIFVGGKLNRGRDGFIGSYTNKQIGEFSFDKAFMGVVGVDIKRNKVYTYTTDDALTKKVIMENSEKCYMLMESTKFAREGNYRYSSIDEFEGIILDEEPSEEVQKHLSDKKVTVLY